jgi:hypothetical protein
MLGEHAASGPKLDLHEIQATVLRQPSLPALKWLGELG